MYKAIIFDFFEVIHQDPLEILLTKNGYKRREGPFAEVCEELDLGKITYRQYVDRLRELLGGARKGFAEEFERLAAVHEGMPELISELQKKYHTALLSNTTADEIRPLMDRHNLWSLFRDVVISAEVGLKKPDPKIFLLMLERLGVKPEEAIFTDDSPRNVAGAASVGIKSILYKSTEGLRGELVELGLLGARKQPQFVLAPAGAGSDT